MDKGVSLRITVLCILTSLSGGAQNLVPNPGFEEYNQCPIDISCVDSSLTVFPFVKHWRRPTLTTTDYFNTCHSMGKAGVPNNSLGHQPARSGNGYAGFYAYGKDYSGEGYREYVQCRLLQPLDSGKRYRVSFYVSLSAKIPPDNPGIYLSATMAVATMGLYLSREPLEHFVQREWVLHVNPQVTHPYGTTFLDDTSGWMQVSGFYTSQGGEEYITIGNFVVNDLTPLKLKALYMNPSGLPNIRDTLSYYYLDDVSVERDDPIDKPEDCVWLPDAFTPNGDGLNDQFGPVTCVPSFVSYQFRIYNRWGELVFDSPYPDYRWNGRQGSTEQSTGTYFYFIRYRLSPRGPEYLKKGSVILVR